MKRRELKKKKKTEINIKIKCCSSNTVVVSLFVNANHVAFVKNLIFLY